MSRNKGTDTGPEVALRKALWKESLRYRLKNRLIGRPDIVFPRARVVVFVDGCFWHGCPTHYTPPAENSETWRKKISATKARDQKVTAKLQESGWTVLRFWDHAVKSDMNGCVEKIRSHVSKRDGGINA